MAADPDLKKKLLSGRRIELAEELSEYNKCKRKIIYEKIYDLQKLTKIKMYLMYTTKILEPNISKWAALSIKATSRTST